MTTLDLRPGTGSTTAVATPTGHREVPTRLRLVQPLPGLPGRTRYRLEPLDDLGVLFAIRSEPDEGTPVRLFVVAPHAFFPDYAPRLDPGVLAGPGAGTGAADRVTFVVVRPAAADGEPPTANLLAPVVVDATDGRAVQVVLDDDLPLRAPVG